MSSAPIAPSVKKPAALAAITTPMAPTAVKAPRNGNPPMGEFAGTVASITISLSTDKPAIFTRITLTDSNYSATHAVRLNNSDSLRIGMDELRSVYPVELGAKSDHEVLTYLMQHTDSLINRDVTVAIEPQIDNTTGLQSKGPRGQAYFNVRLRSNVRNLDAELATKLANQLLAGITTKAAVKAAFATKE